MINAINHTRKEDFSVVWDLGRRCTYACTYCLDHRSNKTSPFVNLDALKKTLDGVVEYGQLLQQYRSYDLPIDLAFTGGEPTAHPDFFDFLEYAKARYPFVRTNLTTNGCYTKRKAELVMKTCHSTTVSYHAEATEQEKELVKNNLQLMHDADYNFSVNVMFHKDYFDECADLCEWLSSLHIRHTARPIGDSGNPEDVADGSAHLYSQEQLEYFKRQWERKESKKKDVMNMATKTRAETSIGRPCCNGKCLSIKTDEKWGKGFRVPTTNFHGWHCMVNWYFLYINSELDAVYHHQTCQVNLEGEIGPIGKASEFDKIIGPLRKKLRQGKMPVIRCPKFHCGCGLCAPKALNEQDAKEIFEQRTKYIEPVFKKEIGSLRGKTIWTRFKEIDADV